MIVREIEADSIFARQLRPLDRCQAMQNQPTG